MIAVKDFKPFAEKIPVNHARDGSDGPAAQHSLGNAFGLSPLNAFIRAYPRPSAVRIYSFFCFFIFHSVIVFLFICDCLCPSAVPNVFFPPLNSGLWNPNFLFYPGFI